MEYDFRIFSQNIRCLRMKHGLSKKKMAKLLGIGIASLSTIEGGRLPPRLGSDIFYRLWEAFGLTADEMFRPLEESEEL